MYVQAPQAYALPTDNKTEDIDVDDRDNPQLVVEYVNEIYAYLRELEAEQSVKENYLEATSGLKGLHIERLY